MNKVKLKKWSKIIIPLVIAVAVVGGYQYYTQKQQNENKPILETATVQIMDMKSIVSATGTIKPVICRSELENNCSCKTSFSQGK